MNLYWVRHHGAETVALHVTDDSDHCDSGNRVEVQEGPICLLTTTRYSSTKMSDSANIVFSTPVMDNDDIINISVVPGLPEGLGIKPAELDHVRTRRAHWARDHLTAQICKIMNSTVSPSQ
jgi:hypothetical protein